MNCFHYGLEDHPFPCLFPSCTSRRKPYPWEHHSLCCQWGAAASIFPGNDPAEMPLARVLKVSHLHLTHFYGDNSLFSNLGYSWVPGSEGALWTLWKYDWRWGHLTMLRLDEASLRFLTKTEHGTPWLEPHHNCDTKCEEKIGRKYTNT